LEREKSAAAAEQAVLTTELDRVRRMAEAAAGVPAAKRGKGLASEIALVRRDSPNRGDGTSGSPGRSSTRCPTRWPH
jgi:hypothetical protein